MKLKFYLFTIAVLLNHFSFAQDWKTFPYQPAGSRISFPKDEGRHASEPIEWWYTAGHLVSASGKTYSYMLTYFYYPASSFDGFRIMNLTDDATGTFYQDTKPLNYSGLSEDHLDIQANVYHEGDESWSNKRDANNHLIPFEYTINSASPGVAFHFIYETVKRPLIPGTDGYLEEGLSNYTYYYSQTGNAVSGTLTLNGVTEAVTGTSWIDRQYGNFNPLTGEKYEWFLLQLSNGMDINLWNIFTVNNTIPGNDKYRILSAYVNDSTQYTSSDFTIERLGFNRMPDSQACYSNKWRLTSEKNKIDLTITSKNKQSEVTWPFRFFEGATNISGTVNGKAVTGIGFSELLHNYENPNVTFTFPSNNVYHLSSPIIWKLNNPDDGRPVTYHLEYSIDDKASFQPLAPGITDTFYLWKNPPLKNGDKAWFKITASSIDGKLQSTLISPTAYTVSVSAKNNNLKIFPNPVKNYLYLEPAFQMNNPVCMIIDAKGSRIKTWQPNSISSKIDVSFLQPGVYFFKINEPAGKVVLKFVKL